MLAEVFVGRVLVGLSERAPVGASLVGVHEGLLPRVGARGGLFRDGVGGVFLTRVLVEAFFEVVLTEIIFATVLVEVFFMQVLAEAFFARAVVVVVVFAQAPVAAFFTRLLVETFFAEVLVEAFFKRGPLEVFFCERLLAEVFQVVDARVGMSVPPLRWAHHLLCAHVGPARWRTHISGAVVRCAGS
ncbi:unnamed protein product [Prorocentrum cordatum]|uniref:Uncharacterized protein n=1 Tax=Prorocentrum cordatum TaxID=2364126 RepID=A0ABN9T218_9DINO|nr:unnamed protein product [Polarella glacialis]